MSEPRKRPPAKVLVPVGIAAALLIALAAQLAANASGGGGGGDLVTGPGPASLPPASSSAPASSSIPADPRPEGQPVAAAGGGVGGFTTYMNEVWTFPDGASASTDAVMGNDGANEHDFYFVLYDEGGTRVIYTSGIIPPGYRAESITLDEPLEDGVYDAVLQVVFVNERKEVVDEYLGAVELRVG